jgi:hypothetical protein
MSHEFSCCAFYAECDYGKNECYFAQTEPDKKLRCRCYQLKEAKRGDNEQKVVITIEQKDESSNKKLDMKQLSLF